MHTAKPPILLVGLLLLHAQLPGQPVLSKDGKTIGDRGEFIRGCVEGAKGAMVQFHGVEVDADRYCSCICDELMPRITLRELERAMERNDMASLLLDERYYTHVLGCITPHMAVSDSADLGTWNLHGLAGEVFLRECRKGFIEELGAEGRSAMGGRMAEHYCRCARERLSAANITYGDLMRLNAMIDGDADGMEEQQAYQALVMPCVQETLAILQGDEQAGQESLLKQVLGNDYSTTVKLGSGPVNGYSVPVSVGGRKIRLYMNTGGDPKYPADLLAAPGKATEWVNKKIVAQVEEDSPQPYPLTNGNTVACTTGHVRDLRIGTHVLPLVKACITPGGDVLLGRSVLERYTRWDVDTKGRALLLFR
jgi:hypothetical protein